MNIFSFQSSIFEALKNTINSSSDFTNYAKVFQESTKVDDLGSALHFYIQRDASSSIDEQSSTGNHTRILSINCRLYIGTDNSESLEEIADKIYTCVYTFVDSGSIPECMMTYNPTLDYQFESTNNFRVADLEIPIFYRV